MNKLKEEFKKNKCVGCEYNEPNLCVSFNSCGQYENYLEHRIELFKLNQCDGLQCDLLCELKKENKELTQKLTDVQQQLSGSADATRKPCPYYHEFQVCSFELRKFNVNKPNGCGNKQCEITVMASDS